VVIISSKLLFRIDYFLSNLKRFLDYVHLDNTYLTSIQKIINDFGFSYAIFSKYEELFMMLNLQNLNNNANHIIAIKHFGWMIYILARGKFN